MGIKGIELKYRILFNVIILTILALFQGCVPAETTKSKKTGIPVIGTFSIPNTSTTLTVSITSFTASDEGEISGYCVTESTSSSSCIWWENKPSSYTFSSAGSKKLYAFVRDNDGNISVSKSATVVVGLTDSVPPNITTFSLPATSNSYTVFFSLEASDNIAVTSYCLRTTSSSSDCTWTTSKPTFYEFTSMGSNVLYVWARDAKGNISNYASATVIISISESIKPLITSFIIPETSTSLTVPISDFTATDNMSISYYCLKTTNSTNDCSWNNSKPTTYNFTSGGLQTLYAWVKDSSGNINQTAASDSVTITLPDTTRPTITAFTTPSPATTLAVNLTFTANEVFSYCIMTSPSTSGCTWLGGLNSTYNITYTFTSAGSKTLYGWARDAAGNVSYSASTSVTINDNINPSVTLFEITPESSSSLSVPIKHFEANDNFGAVSYCLTEVNSADNCVWSSTKPVIYNFSTGGAKTLYAWAKDSSGRVSTVLKSDSISITLPDKTAPSVSTFSLPSLTNSDTVTVSLTVPGDVTHYCLTVTASSSGCGWNALPLPSPLNYNFGSSGTKTLYAWVRDASGNVSTGIVSDSVMIDTTTPTVTGLVLPSITRTMSTTLDLYFTDNHSIAKYCISESDLVASCTGNWVTTKPTSHTFAGTTRGLKNLYAWVQDSAGNTSARKDASIFLTNIQWTLQEGVSAKETSSRSIAVDTSGNIFIAGTTNGELHGNALVGTEDFFVSKYDINGARQWTKQMGLGAKATTARGVATDSSGNVFVTGNTSDGFDGNDITDPTGYFLVKFDGNGNKQWSKLTGSAGLGNTANGVATDTAGNIFVTGVSGIKSFITKYNPTGTVAWTKLAGGTASTQTSGLAVATDPTGNIYIAGQTSDNLNGAVVGAADFFVIKYDTAGTVLWTKQMGVAGKLTTGFGVAAYASGVVVTGQTNGDLDGNTQKGLTDSFITKYSELGIKQWTKQEGAVGFIGASYGVAIKSSGDSFMVGETINEDGVSGSSFYLIKYNAAGVSQITNRAGVVYKHTHANGVSIAPSGVVYATGYTTGGLDGNALIGTKDLFITKFADP